MWSHSDAGSANSLTAPGTGTVTNVRVKIGSTTGPMRVNVIRFLFRQTGNPAQPMSAGPFLEAYGPQFTPQANAITTVPVNLPVQVAATPPPTDLQTIQVIDALALEVLAPNVPIPVYKGGTALAYPVCPGPTGQGIPAPSPNALTSYTTFGYGVLMNADFTAAGGGGGGGAGGGVPVIALPKTSIPVRKGAATIPLCCSGADCAGLVTLLRASGAAARSAAKKPVSYGSARFSVKAGATAKVRVKLNRVGRALLRKRKRAAVTARVTFTSGGGTATSTRVTLRR